MKRLASILAAMLVTSLVLPAASAGPSPGVPNDEMAGAFTITELPYRERLDIRSATVSDEDPDCFGKDHSLWYKVTPDADKRIFTRVRRAHFRSYISVWTGTPGSLTEVYCERYSYDLVFDATAGTTYFIRVASNKRVREGKATLIVGEAPPPTEITLVVDPDGVIESTEQVTISGTITCSQEDEVYFGGILRQPGPDRHFISGYFEDEVEECSPAGTPFEETFFGDGIFEEGDASLQIYAYAYNRFGSTEVQEIFAIDLQKP